jgi:hypothetical protein
MAKTGDHKGQPRRAAAGDDIDGGGAMREGLFASIIFILLYLGEGSEICEVVRKLPGSRPEVVRKYFLNCYPTRSKA